MSLENLAVPRLKWRRLDDGSFIAEDANGTMWSLDQHPTAWSRQGKNADWSEKWWLHQCDENGGLSRDPEIHETCPHVSSRQVTALNRHPDILRYADVLAAGWHNACWRIQNGHPYAEQVMRCGDAYAPLSALLGKPVLVHPQLLFNAELRANRFELRALAAERALRDAGLPVPPVEGR